MKKVVIFSNLFAPYSMGGADKIAYMAAKSLKVDYEVIVITLSQDGKDYQDFYDGIKVYRLALKNLYYPFANKKKNFVLRFFWHLFDIYNKQMLKKAEDIFKLEKPDVFMSHNISGFSVAVWDLAKKFSIPVIHVLHDYYLLCPKSTMFKNMDNCRGQCNSCRVLSKKKKLLSQRVDVVVGDSKFVLNRHLENDIFVNSKKIVIHNAVEITPVESHKKFDSNNLVFGYIGRLHPSKGIERLLDVFSKRVSGINLIVAGTGDDEYVSYIKKKYNHEGITFIGFVNPNDFFPMIDVSIIPSLWNDIFPTVIFESFYFGVPVVSTNRGGIPEMIENGYNGFVYNPDQAGELDGIICDLSLGEFNLEELSKNALKSSADYSFDRFKNDYKMLIKGVIDSDAN